MRAIASDTRALPPSSRASLSSAIAARYCAAARVAASTDSADARVSASRANASVSPCRAAAVSAGKLEGPAAGVPGCTAAAAGLTGPRGRSGVTGPGGARGTWGVELVEPGAAGIGAAGGGVGLAAGALAASFDAAGGEPDDG